MKMKLAFTILYLLTLCCLSAHFVQSIREIPSLDISEDGAGAGGLKAKMRAWESEIQSNKIEGTASMEDGVEEEDGLVYNVDYHGATTHPPPDPKHPVP
ncbi:unnamed protein product [Victoria cruziana]